MSQDVKKLDRIHIIYLFDKLLDKVKYYYILK